MAQRVRSYAAAGAAVAVAGAVAVAPAPAQSVPERALAVASPAFALTTTANPIEAWIETFQNSYTNFLALTGEYFEAPFPVAQQVLVNWAGYVELLPDIPAIVDDISKNVDALEANLVAAQPDNLDALHQGVFSIVKTQIPAGLVPLLDYSTNYNSGMVIGALGLLVSPLLALETQIDEFMTELGNGDIIKAANALINIPAAMTDGFFNGHGVLSLDFLIPLLPEPPVGKITELGIAMGGLLSPAGSIFNSVQALVQQDSPFGPITILNMPGVKAGLLGSWFAANQSSAEAIGWSGEGNPLAALGKTGAEEEAEDEAAPAAASAALPAADAVPPSVVDPEAAALTVDLVSDVADADEESDVVDADEESDVADADEESDVADADEESDVADADVESDVADADEESDVVDADVESDVADGDEATEDSDAAEASDSDDADSDSGADSDSDSGADSDGDSGADSDSSAA